MYYQNIDIKKLSECPDHQFYVSYIIFSLNIEMQYLLLVLLFTQDLEKNIVKDIFMNIKIKIKLQS